MPCMDWLHAQGTLNIDYPPEDKKNDSSSAKNDKDRYNGAREKAENLP